MNMQEDYSLNIKYAIYECITYFSSYKTHFISLKNLYINKRRFVKKLSTIWENPNI